MPTRVEDETRREYWQFLFLYESTSAPGQHEFIVHPFYHRYHSDEKAYTYHNVLYPIFYSHGTNYWNRWTLLYFFTGDDYYHEDTAEDSDFLSPILGFGSGDASGERYVSVFPFYGRLKNKFGWSEINYFLFPLYSSWSHRDYKARSLLWPLIMWGGSKTRNDFRVLPLYSRKHHKGKYDRKTVLWPFFQWGSEALDKKEPRHWFFAFPFYGRKWSDQGNLSAHTFLWLPLLGGFVAYGEDKQTEALDFNALFFLYQYSRNESPRIRKHIIFPFYGNYRFGSEIPPDATEEETEEAYYKSAEFITPFWVNLQTHSVILESDYDILIPFYWNSDTYFKKTQDTEKYFKIWPLFYYIDDSRGRTEFRSLTLWPLRSDEFERVWGVFWSLFEYNIYENGDRYFATMFRLYSRYWNPERDSGHHFLLGFETHNEPEYWSVEFLGGFLGYRRDHPGVELPGGRTSVGGHTLKFLWLDI